MNKVVKFNLNNDKSTTNNDNRGHQHDGIKVDFKDSKIISMDSIPYIDKNEKIERRIKGYASNHSSNFAATAPNNAKTHKSVMPENNSFVGFLVDDYLRKYARQNASYYLLELRLQLGFIANALCGKETSHASYNRNDFVQSDSICVILTSMENFIHSPSIQIVCCRIIQNVVVGLPSDARNKLLNQSITTTPAINKESSASKMEFKPQYTVFHSIFRALKAFPRNQRVVSACCAALDNIVRTVDHVQQLLQEDGISCLAKAMKDFPNCRTTQRCCCSLLWFVSVGCGCCIDSSRYSPCITFHNDRQKQQVSSIDENEAFQKFLDSGALEIFHRIKSSVENDDAVTQIIPDKYQRHLYIAQATGAIENIMKNNALANSGALIERPGFKRIDTPSIKEDFCRSSNKRKIDENSFDFD
jgi:hypothetical protein